MRMRDGVATVRTIPKSDGAAPVILMASGHLYGPAFAPLGFTKELGAYHRVGSLASAPVGGLKVIATITAVAKAYSIVTSPATCDGEPAWHLDLRPLRNASKFPLRELLVSQSSYRMCALSYAIPFQGGVANVSYRFERKGNPAVPVVVSIQARVPYHGIFGISHTRASESLSNYEFPTDVPGL